MDRCRFYQKDHPFFAAHPILTGFLLALGLAMFVLPAYGLLTHTLLYPYDAPWLARISALSKQSPHWLVTVAGIFSNLGSFGPTLVGFALGGYYLHKKCDNRFYLILISYGGGLMLFWFLAFLFNRERPDLPGLLAKFPFPSFPSGHLIQAVTLLAPLLFLYLPGVRSRGARWAILGLSIFYLLLTGFVRLYLNAHYPSDVLAGYGVGLFWTTLVMAVIERRDWPEPVPAGMRVKSVGKRGEKRGPKTAAR